MTEGGTPGERDVDTSYDRYARMVRRALDAPVALVSLVEADRQVFPGAVGLPEPWQTTRETPLSHSFCQYVVADRAPMVVADARDDDRLRDNRAIPDLGVVAYAGWPLTDHDGRVIGSLCAIDGEPREWEPDQIEALADLAAACSSELSERRLRQVAAAGVRAAEDLSHRSRVLLALSENLSSARFLGDVAEALQRVALEHLGCLRAGIWLTEAVDPAVPGEAVPDGMLHYVSPAGDSWQSARRNRLLPADASNPLGAALVSREPVFYPDTRAQNVRYPHLDVSEQVGQARLFVPLLQAGRPVGAMALLWEEVRDLPADQMTTISALAAYTAQAVSRTLLIQERLDALVTLQSSLLAGLPEPEHLELAARYRPAAARDQVGGDWYDAVVMPSGATNLMIGDVVGHDIAAAATMGQLRTMLRAIAWAVDDSPSANVSRLDQAMHDLGVDGMASLVYARIEQDRADRAAGRRILRWTSAGHPPPLLVEPDGRARYLDEDAGDPHASGDLMVGVRPDVERTDNRAEVPVGSTLLLYTDGLVERRGEHLAEGLERLRGAAEARRDLPVPEFLDGVLTDLVVGRLADDVAVLAVRFHDQDAR